MPCGARVQFAALIGTLRLDLSWFRVTGMAMKVSRERKLR